MRVCCMFVCGHCFLVSAAEACRVLNLTFPKDQRGSIAKVKETITSGLVVALFTGSLPAAAPSIAWRLYSIPSVCINIGPIWCLVATDIEDVLILTSSILNQNGTALLSYLISETRERKKRRIAYRLLVFVQLPRCSRYIFFFSEHKSSPRLCFSFYVEQRRASECLT